MKLNKQKWIQEVRRVEAEIKLLKKAMHEPGYEVKFSYHNLFLLKAEATRLYALRRVMKKKDIQLKTFRYLVRSQDGRYIWAYLKSAEDLSMEQITVLILDGIPGWKDSFLFEEPLETAPTSHPIVEVVVF